MAGAEQFESLFGDVTLSQLIIAAGALVFLWRCFAEIKKYLDKRYASKQERMSAKRNDPNSSARYWML